GWLRLDGGRWEWVWARSFRAGFHLAQAGLDRTQQARRRATAAQLRAFLETYQVYRRCPLPAAPWWNGVWPDAVRVPCPTCGEARSHGVWATKVAGLTPEWGVYMIHATCEGCAKPGRIFWVEVNQREGWMQKAGQLPAAGVETTARPSHRERRPAPPA